MIGRDGYLKDRKGLVTFMSEPIVFKKGVRILVRDEDGLVTKTKISNIKRIYL